MGSDKTGGISLMLQRAEKAARRHKDGEARHLFKAILRRDPTHAQALLWMVYLAEDGQAGLAYLARLMDAHPQHPQARTALRWARRRTPTSAARGTTWARGELPRERHATTTPVRQPRRLTYVLVIAAVMIGLGLFWQLLRSPEGLVEAGAPVGGEAAPASASTTEPGGARAWPLVAPRGLVAEIVRLSIPLFTLTPTPTPTPTATPVPTATPNSAWAPVIGRPQTFNMSCESRSAADLAAFWEVPVTELEILESLGVSDNPHTGFVGDVGAPPGSLPPHGYGVYAEPVAAALRASGLDAQAVYELGLDGLRTELLAGRPVMVWATYGMKVRETVEWMSSDGQVSTVVPYMHTFLVTGFDEDGLAVIDAYDGTQQSYAYETFLQVWDLFDQMAVVVAGPLP